MKFLGTGAGEGTPNPFCSCRVCENARQTKGKEVRTRSSFLLNDKVIIDIGADFFAQSVLYDTSFVNVEHVLYTHMHDDHINYTMIWERLVRRAGGERTLKIYVTEDAYRFFEEFYLTSPLTEGGYLREGNAEVIKLEFGNQYSIDEFLVTPYRSSHKTAFEENGANYLIEKDERTLYYAVDSGYFLDETFLTLQGEKLDILIGECTFPIYGENYVDEKGGHMDLDMLDKNLRKLLELEVITKDTQIYLTHISPFNMTHAELCDYIKRYEGEHNICVAYDGMEID